MSDDIVKIDLSNRSIALPDFMQGDADMGKENIKPSNDVARVKVVQKNSDDSLTEVFKPGDCVLQPDMVLLCAADESVAVTPLFHFTEYCFWEAYTKKSDDKSPILKRTIDPGDPIAIKSQKPDTWYEWHPDHPEGSKDAEKHRRRYVEHLVYIMLAHGVAEATFPFLLSFQKGEYRRGARFGSRLAAAAAPIFGTRWRMSTSVRKGVNPYRGVDLVVDAEQRYVSSDLYPSLRESFVKFKELFDAGLLTPTYEDESVVESAPTGDSL
jgi:hypothetical protein